MGTSPGFLNVTDGGRILYYRDNVTSVGFLQSAPYNFSSQIDSQTEPGNYTLTFNYVEYFGQSPKTFIQCVDFIVVSSSSAPSTVTPDTLPTNDTSTQQNLSSSQNTVAIGVSIGALIVGLLIAVALALIVISRRKRREKDEELGIPIMDIQPPQRILSKGSPLNFVSFCLQV